MPEIELRAGRARALLTTRAGMLLDAALERGDDVVHPFARAPWEPDPSSRRPAHLDVLGGEFVAVPFGSAARPDGLAAAWGPVPAAAPEPEHGHGADADWSVEHRDERSVTLVCEYPAGHAVRRLRRTVALRADGRGIDFALAVEARERAAVPIGIHPIFRLPTSDSSLHVDARFTEGRTYPGVVPPGAGVAAPNRRFTRLAAVPTADGTADLGSLPLDRPVEEVLLLTGATGPVRLLDEDGSGVELDWDRDVLPSVLLWISDRALGGDPWAHRYRGLGVEPVAAAFDLHPDVSARANPLTREGVSTAVLLDPAAPTLIRSAVRTVYRGALGMT